MDQPSDNTAASKPVNVMLVSHGYSNGRISKEIGISVATVKNRIARLSRKLAATDRVTLAVTAVRLGIH